VTEPHLCVINPVMLITGRPDPSDGISF